jgi:hypothetical protein
LVLSSKQIDGQVLSVGVYNEQVLKTNERKNRF